MDFTATKQSVLNRGIPPDDFLEQLVRFGQTAPDEIFEPNAVYDIYSLISSTLGPWTGLIRRRAAMLEAMRVHAGFESSWNWNEGVDITNKSSMQHLTGQETGIFQVSADSMNLDPSLRAFIVSKLGSDHPLPFITFMKQNHPLAIEYYARLVRKSIKWAGPLLSIQGRPPAILAWLRKDAMAEFEVLISDQSAHNGLTLVS